MNKENILLLFLSDVKVRNGVVSVTTYKEIGETETTNESAVRYLAQVKNAPPNKIFYFASKKVQAPIENFQVDGKEISHVKYFENRIINHVVGDIKNVMQPCEFDENADMTKTMENVIKMASMIQEYIAGLQKDTEVTLHVDMTGGMRHASLMMLVITRLIQYSGVKIGNILYSNFDRDRAEQFVEESNEIYNLFDVISGAYEFVSFGSVAAIQDYFKEKNPQGELKELLDAMERFSTAIKICQTSIIENELKNLNTHIENFKKFGDKNLHEKLFANLIDTIKKEYGILLSDGVSRIDIIRWCMEKGFWQQVLTLCTEWIPEMIVNFGIYYTYDDKIKADSKVRGSNMLRNWQQNFIISYQTSKADKIDTNIVKGFFEFVETLSRKLANKKINFNDVITELEKFGKLPTFFKEYEDFLKNYPKCASISKLNKKYKISLQKLIEKYPTLGGIVKSISELKRNMPAIQEYSIPLDNLPVFVFENFTAKQLKILFDLEIDENVILYINQQDFTETRNWIKRKNEYIILLQERKAISDFKETQTMEMLEGYYNMRTKRNEINHAGGNATNEISNLKPMVEDYLNKLESYRK